MKLQAINGEFYYPERREALPARYGITERTLKVCYYLPVVIPSHFPRAAFLPEGSSKLFGIPRLRKRSDTPQELIMPYIACFGTLIPHNNLGK